MERTEIARIAHEINRAYCASIGDTSQPAWEDAPDWQKSSALAGVDMHIANPDATPENSHESWLAQKLAEGWKHGPVKDAQKKEHPCFMPYAELPTEQKAKDYLFRAVVHLMKDVGCDPGFKFQNDSPKADVPNLVASSVSAGHVAVQYVGRKPEWRDAIYSTGLYFVTDQVRHLPPVTARQLLRHADLFRENKAEAEPEPTPPASAQAEEVAQDEPADDTENILDAAREAQEEVDTSVNKVLDLKQSVGLMDKDALKTFALTNYGQTLDGRLSVEALRIQAAHMIDQFGAL